MGAGRQPLPLFVIGDNTVLFVCSRVFPHPSRSSHTLKKKWKNTM
jgi:hypothetical protein